MYSGKHPFPKPFRIAVWLLLAFIAGCVKQEAPAQPRALEAGTVCALDGMMLVEYPGPKAQIHYADGEVLYFCDTVEMFSLLLRPEQHKRVRGVFTQDMASADWRSPRGHWIDARKAFYVAGSRRHGSMGPTFAAFSRKQDAEAFAEKYGGKVLRFDEVDITMVDLRGGVRRDRTM